MVGPHACLPSTDVISKVAHGRQVIHQLCFDFEVQEPLPYIVTQPWETSLWQDQLSMQFLSHIKTLDVKHHVAGLNLVTALVQEWWPSMSSGFTQTVLCCIE